MTYAPQKFISFINATVPIGMCKIGVVVQGYVRSDGGAESGVRLPDYAKFSHITGFDYNCSGELIFLIRKGTTGEETPMHPSNLFFHNS